MSDEKQMTHLDLFSGIGGFALAAQANGIKTIQFVEVDQRCRDFLAKTWEGVAIHDDIKTFRTRPNEPVFLLTGGVPCQPASRAGKQRGEEDNRWLWPEALRVLGEVRPAWAVLENPPGIGDVGLAGILSELENQNYAVRVFSVPACAVGSPHRRERFWIVCKSLAHSGHDAGGSKQGNELQERDCRHGEPTQSVVADNEHMGRQEGQQVGMVQSRKGRFGYRESNPWQNYDWLPCADGKVRRAPDDSFSLVDGLHRSLLGGLGNSIVPQVAYEIIKAIIDSENNQNKA